MKGEISCDLVMDEDMTFVEGTYRVENGDWQVFIFLGRRERFHEPSFTHHQWESGATGLVFRIPLSRRLNQTSVKEILGETAGVTHWDEVRGPDSMRLR